MEELGYAEIPLCPTKFAAVWEDQNGKFQTEIFETETEAYESGKPYAKIQCPKVKAEVAAIKKRNEEIEEEAAKIYKEELRGEFRGQILNDKQFDFCYEEAQKTEEEGIYPDSFLENILVDEIKKQERFVSL